MASTSLSSERTRPRGSTVWVGLDPFGATVVGRLQRWPGAGAVGRELAAANRLLPSLTLSVDDPAASGSADAAADAAPLAEPAPADAAPASASAPSYDPAADAIQHALAELLAARQ
ncbi:MAG TPA: hypothetical protein VFU81_04425, partial [Thermomicrobiales bacterium]|nr:hypothetical protein [Thermomicrobiales bacterium]